MNKFIKSILCLGVGGALLLSAGCSGCAKNQVNDPETRTLRLSTGALDKNFNPFFYTAQNDGNMIANTQIGMLNTDNDGKPVCGNNHPTAVLDYKETNIADASNSKGSRTEYEFVIKNGIKFSDGEPLTIADVLFNLYVYLDPAYTGSSTIYSTDIQGLKAYRAQDPELKDDDNKNSEGGYVAAANTRINALINWSNGDTNTLTDDQKNDLKEVTDEFHKELESDWTNLSTSWKESYKDTYRFTSLWEAYLYEHGEVRDQRKRNENGSVTKYYEDKNNNGVREDGELYYTTLDNWQPNNSEGGLESVKGSQALIDMIEEATTDAEVTKYMNDNDVTDRDYATEQLQKKACIEQVEASYINTDIDKSKIAEILTYWATGSTIQEKFINDARTKYFDDLKEANHGEPLVKSVSGITTYSKSGSELKNDFHGKMNESYVADQTYSVLKIVINGVDPKAIYNFAFTVAPLHYYSGTYKGKDYVKEAKEGKGFGVEIGDGKFYEEVLKDPDKIGLPVGAGPYKAADFDGNPTSDKNKFVTSTIVSFVRNENFTTVGTGIENAKIKKVQYKVLGDDDIMSNLIAESIDFGMPNATPTNKSDMGQNSALEQRSYRTGGYGYVGINPKFVPEYKVRQALMLSMNTSDTLRYYGTDLAEYVYRPMTKTSWAYPKTAQEYYPFNAEQYKTKVEQLMEEAGYVIEGGVYTKKYQRGGMSNAPIGTKMKLTFTIAGETTNHPAYLMFCNTRDRLNTMGFDITVKTDVQALKNLASGDLAIWAAAWSSALDPDPYQTYHKDSNASSVLNWNYKNILNDSQKWSYEYELIAGGRNGGNDASISGLIDQGRATTADNLRKEIYAQCLDLIMELAVELPTYQRNDMCVYNTKIIDATTLVQSPSYNMGLFDKLWEINYV